MAHWLMKTEPSTFSIDDLQKSLRQTTAWEGVRNYQARNYMRDQMKLKDLGFFYHSSCAVPAIMGIVEVVKESYPDGSALNPQSPYFDPRATPENPRWFMVNVKLVKKFARPIPLSELKQHSPLRRMQLVQPGNRLSITPVTPEEWDFIIGLSSS